MVLLLGATGYIGQAFSKELSLSEWGFVPLSRKALDYSCFESLFHYIRRMKPEFVINAAGLVGKPNVDACELAREEALWANTLLPQTVARACLMTNTPWAHISSGCIYSGAKIVEPNGIRVERDLNKVNLRWLFESYPERFCGFSETDAPNFSFRDEVSNFYSGTKALAEEGISKIGQVYIWRLQNPFNERDEAQNVLSKLLTYPKVYNHISSFSHLNECVRACLDLWERRAPFGIYNVVNPGAISTPQIIEMIQRVLKEDRRFQFWRDDTEFYQEAAKAPRANCILSPKKILSTGIRIRRLEVALEDSLKKWQPAARSISGLPTVTEPSFVVD